MKGYCKLVAAVWVGMALSTAALADGYLPANASQDVGHFYLAVDAGVFQGNFSSIYNDETDIIPQNIAQPLLQNGYTGGFALGYVFILHNMYSLGAELSANFYSNNARFASGASSTAFVESAKVNGALDLAFVPGVYLAEGLVGYAKIGVSVANISDRLTSPAGYDPTFSTNSTNTNELGGVIGVGIKKYLCPHLAVFSEYTYHDFGNVDFPTFTNFTAQYSHAAHIYASAVTVGLSYDF